MRIVRYTYPNYRRPVPNTDGFSNSPWSGFATDFDRLFETALSDFGVSSASPSRFPVDLYEDQANTYVRAELPGVNREDINVEVADGYLTIAASRKNDAAAEGAAGQSFAFSRSVGLSDEVQADRITAAYENGVLTVTLPKREEAKPKKINVAVN
jgi:HSP20 family protein